MKKKNLFFVLLVPATFYILLKMSGVYVNIYSNSMPYGLYRKVNRDPQRSSIAATCLNDELAKIGLERGYLDRGRCETGIMPIVKRIVGVEGDQIRIDKGNVMINDVEFSQYKILKHDSKGRLVKRYYDDPYTLKKNEFLLMANYKENSWDSRYWGAVNVEFVLEPLLTVGDK